MTALQSGWVVKPRFSTYAIVRVLTTILFGLAVSYVAFLAFRGANGDIDSGRSVSVGVLCGTAYFLGALGVNSYRKWRAR